MKTLTEKFNSVTVKKGETFAVELVSNPTTGYLWDVTLKAGKASLMKEDYTPDSADPRVVGGGGKDVFIFRAEEAGAIVLEAVSRRPWDKSSTGKPLRFDIVVR